MPIMNFGNHLPTESNKFKFKYSLVVVGFFLMIIPEYYLKIGNF